MAGTLDIFDTADARFTFTRRPTALPGDLRPDWRIGVLVLLLRKCCRNGQSSLRKLHVLNWAIRTQSSRDAFVRRLNGQNAPDEVLVRYDPALNRAIDFARGLGLVNRVSGNRVRVANAGTRLADDIENDRDLFVAEKAFVAKIQSRVAETVIEALVKGES